MGRPRKNRDTNTSETESFQNSNGDTVQTFEQPKTLENAPVTTVTKLTPVIDTSLDDLGNIPSFNKTTAPVETQKVETIVPAPKTPKADSKTKQQKSAEKNSEHVRRKKWHLGQHQ